MLLQESQALLFGTQGNANSKENAVEARCIELVEYDDSKIMV